MSVKDLVAINAITHKPKTKIERVEPGAIFTPVSEEERVYLLSKKAARELTDAEAKLRGGTSPAKAPAKKAAKKDEVAPADKTVPMDSDKAGNDDDTDMLN